MKKVTKLFCLLLVVAIIPFMTGCTDNNSAENVAIEMVTRLSKDNYKNIGDIFYHEDSYFDETAFKELVKSKKLNISGNKTIKVKKVESPITDAKTGNEKVTVRIKIDADRVFNVETIKVKNKWFVYDPDFYDGTIEVVVPSNTSVKFNGKVLGKNYVKSEEKELKVYYPDSYRYVKLEKVPMDVYTIKNVISGKYEIAVRNGKAKEVKDVVYTYSQYGKDSENYTKETEYSSHTKSYTFNVISESKEVEEFVKEYVENIYKTATTGTFTDVEKYFDKDSKEYNNIKNYYESLAKKSKKDGNSSYASDYSIKDFEIKRVSYYDDNNIAVSVYYNLNYKMNYSSSSYDRKYETKSILILKKDSKGKYVITNGNNIFVR